MGGNCLKTNFGIITDRVNTKDFISIYKKVEWTLLSYGFAKCDYVKFFASKKDHGDIDIVVGYAPQSSTRFPNTEEVRQLFKTSFVFKNGNVFSVLFNGIQVDLIFVPVSEYRANLDFRNFSPFGNIFSRLLKQRDVSWKAEGLFYTLRIGSSFKKNIFLTDLLTTILNYGGLDYFYYGSSFLSQEDIFYYVTTSPFFRKSIYYFENLNHVNRKRDAVRPDYNAWNEYIKDKKDNILEEQLPNEEENLEKIAYLFPWTLPEIKKGYDEHLKKIKIREKFNGDIISIKTGLTGKDLGEAMKGFKDSLGEDVFEIFAETSPKSEVVGAFMKWWENKKSKNYE